MIELNGNVNNNKVIILDKSHICYINEHLPETNNHNVIEIGLINGLCLYVNGTIDDVLEAIIQEKSYKLNI